MAGPTNEQSGRPVPPQGKGTGWLLSQMLLMGGFFLIPESIAIPGSRALQLAAGFAILLVGLALTLPGLSAMGSNLTPFPRPRRAGQLVREGVYRWVRHPIYGGLVICGFAYALLRGSGLHLVGAVVLLLFFDAKTRREERYLEVQFPDYADYRKTAKRLIPWLY